MNSLQVFVSVHTAYRTYSPSSHTQWRWTRPEIISFHNCSKKKSRINDFVMYGTNKLSEMYPLLSDK